jgi:hypothetical protein
VPSGRDEWHSTQEAPVFVAERLRSGSIAYFGVEMRAVWKLTHYQSFTKPDKLWQFVFSDIPHDFSVDTKIVMDELVAHPRNVSPGHALVLRLEASRNALADPRQPFFQFQQKVQRLVPDARSLERRVAGRE